MPFLNGRKRMRRLNYAPPPRHDFAEIRRIDIRPSIHGDQGKHPQDFVQEIVRKLHCLGILGRSRLKAAAQSMRIGTQFRPAHDESEGLCAACGSRLLLGNLASASGSGVGRLA